MSTNTMHRGVVFAAIILAGAFAAPAGIAQEEASWSMAAPLPIARNEMKAAVINGKVYLIGGSWDEGEGDARVSHYTTGYTTEYDPATNTWTERSRPPVGSTHQAMGIIDGQVYVAGGFAGSRHTVPNDDFYRYDPATDTWETLPSLPTGVQGAGAGAAVDGKFHVIGGRVMGNEVFATHIVYDPATNSWGEAAPLQTARDHAASFVVDGKIHVIGGRLGETEVNVGTHDIYDPATDSWTSGPDMPTGRSSLAYDMIDGMLVVAGGECRPDPRSPFGEVEAYDIANERWLTLPSLPVARHAFSAAAIDGKLFMFGGSTNCGGSGKLDETLVLTMQ